MQNQRKKLSKYQKRAHSIVQHLTNSINEGRVTDPKSAPSLVSPRGNVRTAPPEIDTMYDTIIIGTGFSGMVAAIKLQEAGLKVRVFEKGTDVGGTWYWNRYPGCTCDVQSIYYSYSFDEKLQQDWTWPLKYSKQPDIHRYAKHVAERFDIYKLIRFSTEVNSCIWDEESCQWLVETLQGDKVKSRHVIIAIGSLSLPQMPSQCIAGGLWDFEGQIIHTARWPEGKAGDMSGLRVAVIGTGATAIQVIPEIAPKCKHVYVFQRTPPTVSPRRNKVTTPEFEKKIKSKYTEIRKNFIGQTDMLWSSVNNKHVNKKMMDNLRRRIRKTVKDPKTAEAMCPTYPFGCKRPIIHDEYYTTFNLPHVELVDVSADNGLKHFNKKGPVVGDKVYPVDVIIFATGFDAMGGSNYTACGIQGMGGLKLNEKWKQEGRPTSLYGVHVYGFPNMYLMQGPHSPSVLSCMINTSEDQAVHSLAAIKHAMTFPRGRIETTKDAEIAWTDKSEELGLDKVQSQCQNWYNKDKGRGALQIYTGSLAGYRNGLVEDVTDGFPATKYTLQ